MTNADDQMVTSATQWDHLVLPAGSSPVLSGVNESALFDPGREADGRVRQKHKRPRSRRPCIDDFRGVVVGICPRIRLNQAQALLDGAIALGVTDDLPKRPWTFDEDGVLYEAQESMPGRYHGYPLWTKDMGRDRLPQHIPRDVRDRLRKNPRPR